MIYMIKRLTSASLEYQIFFVVIDNEKKIEMFDVGLHHAGASIVLATSNDQKHPPENMTDG